METYDYAIVGNSAAAINAVESIRALGYRGQHRPLLRGEVPLLFAPTHILPGGRRDIKTKGMYYRPANYYHELEVDFRGGERVVSISPSKKTLTTAGKEKVKWRRLLLATGFTPFVPPIEGLEEVEYITFVSWDDAKRMLSLTSKKVRALVVGAGLIGMKAAEALHARGATVTVVEKLDRVLPLALDDKASELVAERCRDAEIDIVTGLSVSRLEGRGGGKGKAVLEDGAEMDFDLLVMAVGVRPRTELAEAAGLPCERGIQVDAFQRTTNKDIYAAGDAVRAMDIVLGEPSINALWPVAALQGKYAGRNMAGEEAPYPGCNAMNAVEFFGLPVLSAGIVNPPQQGFKVITRQDGGDYRKVVLQGDILVGMLMAGTIERAGILTSLIQEKANVRRMKNSLLDEGFGLIHFPHAVRQGRIEGAAAGLKATEVAKGGGG